MKAKKGEGIDSKKIAILEKISGGIQKKYGKESITYLGNNSIIEMPRFTSQCEVLDMAIGGGYPNGKIIEIYGPESSGKSTLCLHAISSAQRAFPESAVTLVDVENCFKRGSFIFDAEDGVYRTVEELFLLKPVGFKVGSLINGKMVVQDAKVKKLSKQKTYKILTSYQRELNLTDNHRVLTSSGYKEVKDINVGDILYAPSKITTDIKETDVSIEDEMRYRLLGYWLGDGTIGKAEISTIDSFIVNDLKKIAEIFNCNVNWSGTLARFRKKDLKFHEISKDMLCEAFDMGLTKQEIAFDVGCHTDTITSRCEEYGLDLIYNFKSIAKRARDSRNIPKNDFENIYSGGLKSEIYNFLSQFDCFNSYSYEKRIPAGLCNMKLRQILAGLFMTDGTVVNPEKNHRCTAEYVTTSKNLAMDIQCSLQRFGIFSAITTRYKLRDDGEYYRPCYGVTINGYDQMQIFNNAVPLFGYKKDKIENALKMVRNANRYLAKFVDNKDLVELVVRSIDENEFDDIYEISVNNNIFEEQNLLADGVIVHNSFDPQYAKELGVNVSELLVSQPNDGTEALNIVVDLMKEGVKLIIVDSIAALMPKEEGEAGIEQQTMGLQARMMSQALRKINSVLGQTQSTIIFTNQTREKIGVMYGDPTVTPGGNAMKFYASIRIKLSKQKVDKTQEEITSAKVKASIVKNKTFPPFKSCEFTIKFGKGIDEVDALVNACIDEEIIEKKGGWYTVNGEQIQGYDAVYKKVNEDVNVKNKLKETLKQSGLSSKKDVEEEAKKEEKEEKTESKVSVEEV